LFRWATLLLGVALLLLGALLYFAPDDPAFSLLGTLLAMCVIIGFAVAAAGWTIRHDV
jgi:hypothetical protein